MAQAAPAAASRAASRAVGAVMREHRGRLLAALIAQLRDFQLAEDCLQEAAISALSHWGRVGLPDLPQNWLLRVAYRKAIDRLRGATRAARNAESIARLAREEAAETEEVVIPDERLRLIFTCCHPALEEKTRVALTLRSLCGLSTPQVAAVFLDHETTMGQRLSRARAKIAAAGIPFVLPEAEDLAARLESVLTVIYLIFTAGYRQGPVSGADLCTEAVFLAHMVDSLSPGLAEVEGCLALLLLTHARAAARLSEGGETLPPQEQDRSKWNRDMVEEGRRLLDRAVARRSPGPFQIKAAIAALHLQDRPDWPQIAQLYAGLSAYEPTPVVRLNHAVALAEAGHDGAAADMLTALESALANYQPFHAARAAILAKRGQTSAAHEAYGRAIALAETPADVAFLMKRRAKLPQNGA